MASNRIRKVVVAGGGTAGWIAASTLAYQLKEQLEVTLVESSSIATVGVGEATVPPIRNYHRFMNIDEREFLREVAGTFKLSISFENFVRPGHRYIHPFGITGKGTLVAGFEQFWLESLQRGMASQLPQYSLEAMASLADRFAIIDEPGINYAYHMDAALYVRFLRKKFQPYGIRQVEGKITEVRQNAESGYVEALVLDDGQVIDGDLFIDCTGFRGLLIEQTLNTGYEDWGHWLPCDRAVAMQAHSTRSSPEPYTRAIAHEAGWRWNIPVQHRVGCGLVYDSRYMSDDEAHARLLNDVGAEPVRDPWLVRFRTGRRMKAWNKNVVALGLASGFIEPMESTSIHLAMSSVMQLVELFPSEGISNALVDVYNDRCRRELEHVRDFIILHYHANQRDEKMWTECRQMTLPDSLQRRIDAWRDRAYVWHEEAELFATTSWIHVLLGQEVMPRQHHPLPRELSDADLGRLLASIRQPIDHAVARMPQQQAFIDRYCKASPDVWPRRHAMPA
ncbi:tryptophan halogenase family protein [Oleiagrimonas sp. C23AA]|uniref:tryptophan 7-halogenase n=1 Tax=Oleiagrimonas sp. C23AA TaxID=2719047 RepID=UPI00141F4979|nr:tryptophan 7-halogenase [Oleiagrimonas sp. C23AA]